MVQGLMRTAVSGSFFTELKRVASGIPVIMMAGMLVFFFRNS